MVIGATATIGMVTVITETTVTKTIETSTTGMEITTTTTVRDRIAPGTIPTEVSSIITGAITIMAEIRTVPASASESEIAGALTGTKPGKTAT